MSQPEMKVSRGSFVRDDPQFSIIIPSFNASRYIAETLDSVLAQSVRSFEVVVVNDASPDTAELLEALSPYLDRIILIDRPTNGGASAARNVGVQASRGELIVFLDADDLLEPTFLEELARFINDLGLDMGYAEFESFEGTIGNTPFYSAHPNPPEGPITRTMLINGACLILPSASLIRRAAFEKAGGFDETVRRTEDFDLWMRMIFDGAKIGFLNKRLVHYRVSPQSVSGDAVVRFQRSIDQWDILKSKLAFTESELRVIDQIQGEYRAAAIRTRALDHVYARRWKAALADIKETKRLAAELSLPFAHRAKLTAAGWLLKVWPTAARALILRRRERLVEFLPSYASRLL